MAESPSKIRLWFFAAAVMIAAGAIWLLATDNSAVLGVLFVVVGAMFLAVGATGARRR